MLHIFHKTLKQGKRFDYDGLHVGVFDLDHAVQVAVALLEAHGVPLP